MAVSDPRNKEINKKKQCGSMSFVWAQNDHVKANFFHHVKLWASGASTLGLGLRDLWGATVGV